MEYTKRLLVLEGLLSTLPDCQGWMIAKCRISLGNRKMKTSDQFPLQILKKDGRLAKIHICSFAGEEKDLLDVTLINPGQKMALGSSPVPFRSGFLFVERTCSDNLLSGFVMFLHLFGIFYQDA